MLPLLKILRLYRFLINQTQPWRAIVVVGFSVCHFYSVFVFLASSKTGMNIFYNSILVEILTVTIMRAEPFIPD